MNANVVCSTLGLKYPRYRDEPLHLSREWLESKYIDDGAEGFWRIHDKIYDLTQFINSHPGGADWINLTKGTDITEAFESHHLSNTPVTLLPKYFVKDASTPRSFPFTFTEDGFYKTLKKRILPKYQSLSKSYANTSKYIADSLMAGYILTFFFATYFQSYLIGVFSGLLLSLTAIAAHNYFHQKDSFRMYYFDFTLMSSKDWRISHVLSHHMYPNTVNDLEISKVEPFIQYLPKEKNIFVRYGAWFYIIVVYIAVFPSAFLTSVIDKDFRWSMILPFTPMMIALIITNQNISGCLALFAWIYIVASIHFGFVGLNAGHHHPEAFHDGDTARPKQDLDWGIHQLDAVTDRADITGSHFLVLTNFGDHALHHLFPTIDHGYLQYLYPVFLETCKEFGVEWRLKSRLDIILGQYKQIAKVIPNKIAPKKWNKKTI